MHLIFYLRGIDHKVDFFKTLLQGQFFKLRIEDSKTKEKGQILVQGALRPSILGAYEYIFPREALPEVLAMLDIKEDDTGVNKKFFNNIKAKTQLAMLRALFGAQKIPKEAFKKSKKYAGSLLITDSERGLARINIEGVSIHPIGIKEDTDINFHGTIQEGL